MHLITASRRVGKRKKEKGKKNAFNPREEKVPSLFSDRVITPWERETIYILSMDDDPSMRYWEKQTLTTATVVAIFALLIFRGKVTKNAPL